jgi:hypothetical protein
MRAEFAIACARLLTFDPGVPLSADWVTEQGAPVAIPAEAETAMHLVCGSLSSKGF